MMVMVTMESRNTLHLLSPLHGLTSLSGYVQTIIVKTIVTTRGL